MKHETLRPLETYNKHKARFGLIESDLLQLYQHYLHKKKIVTLLEYWLFNVRIIFLVFGKSGLKEFFISNIPNPTRFAIKDYITGSPKPIDYKYNRIIFFICDIMLKKYYLVGANLFGIKEKIIYRITKTFLSSIPIIKDRNIKSKVINNMMVYFGDISFDGFEQYLEKKTPYVFFSEPYKYNKNNSVIEIECAASSFLEFMGVEKIFLLNKPLFIKGLQHGGGYDTFKIDYSAYYEKRLSDIFIGWGLSDQNQRQHRFKKFPEKYRLKLSKSKKRLIWVEDSDLHIFYSMIMPLHHYQCKDTKTTEYIFEELKKSKIHYYSLPHPSAPSDKYNIYRKNILDRKNSSNGESLFLPNDVGIFDNSGATLIHYFIENKMPFLHVIDKSDIERFTTKQKEWFNILYESGLAFFNHEDDRLYSAIIEILKNTYELPKAVNKYHNDTFINI